MRLFLLEWPISQIGSAKSSGTAATPRDRSAFPPPWSHYVRLMSVKNPEARRFYEAEALRCGWAEPQLDR
jgi:hypothetical protein